jgi:hypothetical protein
MHAAIAGIAVVFDIVDELATKKIVHQIREPQIKHPKAA